MADLKKLIESKKKATSCMPEFFRLSEQRDKKDFNKLLKSADVRVVDQYENQLYEYFEIKNPALIFSPDFKLKFDQYLTELKTKKPLEEQGVWVYFPWRGTVSHILEDQKFQEVRTARNKNLITKEEQEKFYNSSIGIVGLSVGNSVAMATVLQGGGKNLKLADHDTIALTNTNRIRSSIDNLGLKKVDLVAQQIYEINPYVGIELFPKGLSEDNMESFFSGLDIVVDEVDNLAIKWKIREFTKKLKLPVLMGADNGDGVVIDVERYDLNENLAFFNGRLIGLDYQKLKNLDKIETGRLITKLIGEENVGEEMSGSLREIGKTLVSWPQLGGAAMLNGLVIAYYVRNILTRDTLLKDRLVISLKDYL